MPWQLLAALAQAQQADAPDAGHRGPFRIVAGTTGITPEDASELAESAGFIARQLVPNSTGMGWPVVSTC